jgi:Lipocalin-like domain
MKRLILSFVTASALIFGVFLPKEVAARTPAKHLVGTWTLVSVTLEQDGKKSDLFGPNPRGQVTFGPNGRMSFIITRSDIPKFASNNRQAGTPEENKAVVQGCIAYFGTYSVSEKDKTFTVHILGSTFPNWIGTDQKRPFTISGDELDYSDYVARIGNCPGSLETSQVRGTLN